jgi:hypothetical protein
LRGQPVKYAIYLIVILLLFLTAGADRQWSGNCEAAALSRVVQRPDSAQAIAKYCVYNQYDKCRAMLAKNANGGTFRHAGLGPRAGASKAANEFRMAPCAHLYSNPA